MIDAPLRPNLTWQKREHGNLDRQLACRQSPPDSRQTLLKRVEVLQRKLPDLPPLPLLENLMRPLERSIKVPILHSNDGHSVLCPCSQKLPSDEKRFEAVDGHERGFGRCFWGSFEVEEEEVDVHLQRVRASRLDQDPAGGCEASAIEKDERE